MTYLLDGNHLAHNLRQEICNEVLQLKTLGYKTPKLGIILVGEDPASQSYVRNKVKDCQDVGVFYQLEQLPVNISEDELLLIIRRFNKDISIDGFIVQLPLPPAINTKKIILSIHSDKDVDGLHPINLGKMVLGLETFLPATPSGIMSLFERYSITTMGKHIVIIGRSSIVGQPLSILLSRKSIPGNSTVTLTHSFTPNIIQYTRQADIIITALGIPGFLTSNMIRKNSIIIDVGITRIKDHSLSTGYRLVGDVDFKSVYGKAAFLTPVPGGIGPLTRVMILKNTLLAVKRTKSDQSIKKEEKS